MKKDYKFPIIKDKIRFDFEKTEKKRFYEKLTFLCMINMYCKGKSHEEREDFSGKLEFDSEIHNWIKSHRKFTPGIYSMKLCPTCYELLKKVVAHTGRCPHMAYKSFCHHCPRPCYPKSKREEIVPIMAYGGPRLILRHSILTLRHGVTTMKSFKLLKSYENKEINNNDDFAI